MDNGVNDYRIRFGVKLKTFHAGMLKKYVDRQVIYVKGLGLPISYPRLFGLPRGCESGLERGGGAVNDKNLLELGTIHLGNQTTSRRFNCKE